MFFKKYKPKNPINVYEPFQAKNTKKYVLDCINSNLYTHTSPYISRFESQIADFIGVKHCIATCNGSVSLMLILKALGIGHGDEVITQNLTYAATVSSIINVGAMPVLIDSQEDYQMDISLVEAAITPKTKAVMVAGLYGYCPDLIKLKSICEKNNIYLIEDAAEVFGCNYETKMVGSIGIASSFSFYGNKIITSGGEGGCVCTDDDSLAAKLRLLRGQSHIGNFIHEGEGYNFRISAMPAAVGCAQLEHLDEIIVKKKNIADYYIDKFLDKGIVYSANWMTTLLAEYHSSEWMPLFLVDFDFDYNDFRSHMLKNNVEVRPCFTPISLMPGFNYKLGSALEVSLDIYKQAFNLPCSPNLTIKQLDYIINATNNYFESIL